MSEPMLLAISLFLLGLNSAFCLMEVVVLKAGKSLILLTLLPLYFLLNKIRFPAHPEDVAVLTGLLLLSVLYYLVFRLPNFPRLLEEVRQHGAATPWRK